MTFTLKERQVRALEAQVEELRLIRTALESLATLASRVYRVPEAEGSVTYDRQYHPGYRR